MLTCREVTTAIASGDLPHRSWIARLELRLHLVMCRTCRRYAAQIAAIGDTAKKAFRYSAARLESLERSILESLRDR